mmetsp:Transcript_14810/g.44494  ORF Transcript_14810/g.44494 Transcript_14810/m.44494 type:complete len:97 (-) Transcript_14810:98-388(-)
MEQRKVRGPPTALTCPRTCEVARWRKLPTLRTALEPARVSSPAESPDCGAEAGALARGQDAVARGSHVGSGNAGGALAGGGEVAILRLAATGPEWL